MVKCSVTKRECLKERKCKYHKVTYDLVSILKLIVSQVDKQTNTTNVRKQCVMICDILWFQFFRLLKGKPPKRVANGNINFPVSY